MAKRNEDRYTNLASAHAIETVSATINFAELVTGISLGVGIGMLIDQIDYEFRVSSIEDLVAVGDFMDAGWFTSNAPSVMDMDDRRLIHKCRLQAEPVIGTPASAANPFQQPLVYQFFPPMIIAAPRIYLAAHSGSLAAGADVRSRLYFRYIDLSTQEYLELAEAFILVG